MTQKLLQIEVLTECSSACLTDHLVSSKAYATGDHSNPCLTGKSHECPERGLETLWWNWNERPAGHLWQMVEGMIWDHRNDQSFRKSVLDLVMDEVVRLQSKAMTPQFPVAQTYQ